MSGSFLQREATWYCNDQTVCVRALRVIIETVLGILIILLTALAWAISSALLKYLSSRINAISVNTLRLWIGAAALIILALATGRLFTLSQAPTASILLVLASGILSNAAGDTIYIKSLSYLDVSIAYPISQSAFPLFTVVAAIFLLNEPFTLLNMLGSALIIIGILMLVRNNGAVSISKAGKKGVGLALLAAVLWAAGSISLKLGLAHVDTFAAATIRISLSALVLTTFALSRPTPARLTLKLQGKKNLILIGITGILTYFLAAIGYVTAIQLLGAGKTVLLSASAPLFLLPFSVFILKERISPTGFIGLLFAVAGICLVAL